MAVTEMFRRIEAWRIANGRDPRSGRPVRNRRMKPSRKIDDRRLIYQGLQYAIQYGAEHLIDEYRRVAEIVNRDIEANP